MDKDKQDQENTGNDVVDMALARRIRELDDELTPERDLWVGIQRQILDYPQQNRSDKTQVWMPYAVAASLVIAVSAMLLNVTGVPGLDVQTVGVEQISTEYLQVRNPMVEEFSRVNESLDQKTMTELYRNFEILDQARKDLEKQVKDNPENRRLVEMLIKVHEQELELLKQDFSGSSRSM
jgi:hypothetical protein